ncbi:MAG: hypothetical protein PHY12_13110 [Eubacteriales bacterium]|nr:hypothetical protein [Eubacteriales bacterium]
MKKRLNPALCVACAAMLALSFAVFYAVALRPSSDLSIHATWAAEGDFTQPRSFLHHGMHPLWHALVALVMLLGVPVKVSAALVTALCKAAELALLYAVAQSVLGEKAKRGTALLCALCASLVSALCLPWFNPTVYIGVGSPNTWHSPTQMIAMLFMLVCVPMTARCYDAFERRLPEEGERAMLPWKNVAWLAALLLVSLLAKPTFMQAFLPAACLFFLAQWIRHPKNSRYFGQMMLAALPSVLFMVFQYLYYFGIIVPSQGSMTLLVTGDKAREVLVSLLLIQAFPLFALLTDRREKGTLLTLTVALDAVGVAEQLLLSETGRRAADGNFGWAMMGGALMLWAVMLPRFVGQFQAREKRAPLMTARWAGGFALLLWHLASGVYYIVYLLGTTNSL